MSSEALHKTAVVRCPPAVAYQHFTAGFSTWWPLATHSVFEDTSAHCAFEPHAGGRIFERARDGSEALWGTVLLVEPARRVLFTWHPGRSPVTAQEVTVQFLATPGGTRVELTHDGWHLLGPRAEAARASYETGWDAVLGVAFAACANRG